MDYRELIQRVQHHTGVEERTTAERLVQATVDALGSCLPIQDRARWAERLPSELRALFRAADYRAARTASAALAEVPAAVGVPRPYATEQAQAVIQILAQALEPDERALFARHLPDELGALVLEPLPPSHEPFEGRATQRGSAPGGSTLATGSPSSAHPISSSHPKDAQSGSVAAWNGHRMDHSLGAGRPVDPNRSPE